MKKLDQKCDAVLGKCREVKTCIYCSWAYPHIKKGYRTEAMKRQKKILGQLEGEDI